PPLRIFPEWYTAFPAPGAPGPWSSPPPLRRSQCRTRPAGRAPSGYKTWPRSAAPAPLPAFAPSFSKYRFSISSIDIIFCTPSFVKPFLGEYKKPPPHLGRRAEDELFHGDHVEIHGLTAGQNADLRLGTGGGEN